MKKGLNAGSLLVIVLLLFAFTGCNKAQVQNEGNQISSKQETIFPSYKLGTVLTFNETGNAGPFKGEGWSSAEKDFTWTDGNTANLHFSILQTDKDLTLKVKSGAFVAPGKIDKQLVNVLANGKQIEQWEFTKTEAVDQTANIPKNILGKGELTIQLQLKNATSPDSLNLNQDRRKLGVDVVNVTLE